MSKEYRVPISYWFPELTHQTKFALDLNMLIASVEYEETLATSQVIGGIEQQLGPTPTSKMSYDDFFDQF